MAKKRKTPAQPGQDWNAPAAELLAEFAPAYAVGFPGGRGTADMHARLVKAGVPVWLPWGLDGSGQSSSLLR